MTRSSGRRAAVFLVLLAVLWAAVMAGSAVEPLRTLLAELTDSTGYSDAPAEEIAENLALVCTEDDAAGLIIGDSVCNQVFGPFQDCNEDWTVAATNRAVTLAGQYLLAEQFLDAHPQAEEVWLMLAPDSFAADFDANYGYQYVVTGFAPYGLLSHLDAETRAELARAYGAPFLSEGFVRWINASPLGRKLYLNALVDLGGGLDREGALCPMAQRTLDRLETLCREHGAAFHLVCDPLASTEYRQTSLAALEQAFREAGLYDRYAGYFTDVVWYDPGLFGPDGLHFDYETSDLAFFADVVRDLQQATGGFAGMTLQYD
ncbi:MAG: hypothetical protein U0L91_04615 [Gemmiger sp.]|uniref:hypothetical protein n=1 Tax=Gemmiger sp. TaxID=2049027 RepID=UPI002E79AACF|nr:hypothetical protein [Gemmiger sp.]MEE0800544.1 hypothetical protein [Gemmiger sp.]